MCNVARFLLLLGGVGLLAYPMWGLLDPSSYTAELRDHYAFAEGVSSAQVRTSAMILWLSNGVLALAFFSTSQYIKYPTGPGLAKTAGIALILYPFVRIVVEVWSGVNLTSHVEDTSISIELSAENAFYIIYGMALLGMDRAWSEFNESNKMAS